MLYMCMRRTFRVPRLLWAVATSMMLLGLAVALLFWHYNVKFW